MSLTLPVCLPLLSLGSSAFHTILYLLFRCFFPTPISFLLPLGYSLISGPWSLVLWSPSLVHDCSFQILDHVAHFDTLFSKKKKISIVTFFISEGLLTC